MDVLTNGTIEEKAAISFRIVDIDADSILSFPDFQTAVLSVLEMWYTMTGSQVRLSESTLRYLYNKLDLNNKGEVSIREYVHVLSQQSDMFNWFDILNNGYSASIERPSVRKTEPQHKDMDMKEIVGARDQITEVLDMIQSLQPDDLTFLSGKISREKLSPVGSARALKKAGTLSLPEDPILPKRTGRKKSSISPATSAKQSKFIVSPINKTEDVSKKYIFSDVLTMLDNASQGERRGSRPIKKEMLLAESPPVEDFCHKYGSNAIHEIEERSEDILEDESIEQGIKEETPKPTSREKGPRASLIPHQKHTISKGDESPGIKTPESSRSSENDSSDSEKGEQKGDEKDEGNHSSTSFAGTGNSFLSTTLTETKKNELVEKLRRIKRALSVMPIPEE